MTTIPKSIIIIGALSLTACGSGSDGGNGDGDALGGGGQMPNSSSFEAAADYYQELLFFSAPLTDFADRPDAGSVDYSGVIGGVRPMESSGPAFEYYADISMNVNFQNPSMTGEFTRFKTNLAGFETPEGTITFNGAPTDFNGTGEEMGLRIRTDKGSLTQGDNVAMFDTGTLNNGRFQGTEAQFVSRHMKSTFDWTEGEHAGTTTEMRGFFQAERVE